MQISLKKSDVKRALSFPAVVDIVLYKNTDEEDKDMYRLKYVKDLSEESTTTDTLARITLVDKFAPDIITGEIILNSEAEMRIRSENGSTYFLQKKAQDFEFVDAGKFFTEHRLTPTK